VDDRAQFSEEAGILFLRHWVQTGSEAHPPSYPMGNEGILSRGKVAGA